MKFNKILRGCIFLVIGLTALKANCSLSNSREKTRFEDEKIEFGFVGHILFKNGRRCSTTIVHHGIILTAKHCFTHFDIKETNFQSTIYKLIVANTREHNEIAIETKELKSLNLGLPQSDIAVITYNPEVTKKIRQLKFLELSLIEKKPEIDGVDQKKFWLFKVGYPNIEIQETLKIIDGPCALTGNKKKFIASINDPGYEGEFYETSCSGWYGDSGGAILLKQDQTFKIVGLTTHTFNVDFSGNLLEQFIQRDKFGKKIGKIMFTPITKNILDELNKQRRLLGRQK